MEVYASVSNCPFDPENQLYTQMERLTSDCTDSIHVVDGVSDIQREGYIS